MNPYQDLSDNAFWKKAVASKSIFDISELWSPKFNIKPNQKISTFGSCFAQHIGQALKSKGYNWNVAERAPQGLSGINAKKFNYSVFSARTGNIYTTSLLKQWVNWASELEAPNQEVWESGGRFYDPFRPVIEPDGFVSVDELVRSREMAIKAFKACILESDIFVFTLGLTESWFNVSGGYEYPMCPGTAAGEYSKSEHEFNNQKFVSVRRNLLESIRLIREVNPRVRFILTVSPVPLTATNSDNNVLVATMESKSILRAVAGEVARDRKYIDYFPSYEIINSPVFGGVFFEPNKRTVNPAGVDFVMNHFFTSLWRKYGKPKTIERESASSAEDVVCEEELLNAFSPGGRE